MTEIEKVEKLREKASVSYADAKRVLEANDWDLLDAMIMLEREGAVEGGGAASTTPRPGIQPENEPRQEHSKANRESLGDVLSRFFKWVSKIVNIANTNTFSVEKDGNSILATPVSVFAILLLFCFWIILPLIVIGLFFGYKYSFRGPNLERDDVNSAMHKATDVADDIKRELGEKKSGGKR